MQLSTCVRLLIGTTRHALVWFVPKIFIVTCASQDLKYVHVFPEVSIVRPEDGNGDAAVRWLTMLNH
jgi:hypothetical protein